MISSALSPCITNLSIIAKVPFCRKSNINFGAPWKSRDGSLARKASTSSNSLITDFDLYELLGIDSSSDQAQVKLAYRALQKRCHPDIAGPTGHDMAIILNEAYAVLSDPHSRFQYDKEQAKIADLHGYTGKPIYSVWLGSESEKRAIFVDEVKCVGCLKCALFADKTFAVESVYGRARVVAQWADSEDKIQAAIEACPVDCITVVERSNLAALEFLMSKQPRGRVRIGTGNTVGTRTSNVFDDLEKFQAKYEASLKHPKLGLQESDIQGEARTSAVHAIKAISNWLYWQAPGTDASAQYDQDLTPLRHKSGDPIIKRLKNVTAARKQARNTVLFLPKISTKKLSEDEYWVPRDHVPNSNRINNTGSEITSESSTTTANQEAEEELSSSIVNSQRNLVSWLPMPLAMVAAVIVRSQLGDRGDTGIGLKEHIAGSLVRDIVNSSWLQVILAGVTWYLIGMYVVELIAVVQCKLGKHKK